MPKLLLKFNMAVIKEIPIPEGTVLLNIGRKEDNDIVIDNPAVSGHHAKLVKHGNKFFIEDLNSTNGTFIAGKKILKAELQHNMQVDIAKHSLVFIYESPQEAPAPGPTPAKSSDQTVVIDAGKQKEILEKMAAAQEKLTKREERIGCIKVTEGVVDKTEIELVGLNTYIGMAESSGIKIKPAKSLFGVKPVSGNVAVINRRPEGYYIFKAIREGYSKVDGKIVKEELVELKEGSIIESGKTRMVFFLKDRS